MTRAIFPIRAALAACIVVLFAAILAPLPAAASTFDGNHMGVEDASGINTGGNDDLRESATEIMFRVISFMGLIAVVVIVIAAILLIVGFGNDEARNRLIKVMIYVAVGMIVIVLASAFVTFVVNITSGT